MKNLILLIAIAVFVTGCSFQKHAQVAETLARVVGRDLGYRSEQIKAMADSQLTNDPLMAANLRALAGLLSPDAGIFNSGLDQAAQDGFADGVKLFQSQKSYLP